MDDRTFGSAYDRTRQQLVANGYHPHPIGPGTKRPTVIVNGEYSDMVQWQSPGRSAAPSPQPGAGVGARLGLQREGVWLVAFDWDDDDVAIAALGLFPSAVQKEGRRGFTAFFVAHREIPSKDFRVDGKCVMQVLSAGRQTVLPPSIHPDTGKPYIWTTNRTLLNTSVESLPELPNDYLDQIRDVIESAGKTLDPEEEPKPAPNGGYDEASPFKQLNDTALRNFEAWLPDLNLFKFRRTQGRSNYEAVATWRPSSTGRPLEQRNPNLKFSARWGIKDHGASRGYSCLDLVMAARACDRSAAYDWLAERVLSDEGPEVEFDKIKENAEAPSGDPAKGGGDNGSAKKDEPKTGSLPPLTIEQWEARTDVKDPDFLMGELLSTTTRMLLVAATGLGKTQLAMALAIHIAAGKDFLHWRGYRPARVLYIDGEMSKRQFRKRILDLAHRFTGPRPNTLFFLCKEDVPNLAPLNTGAGQKLVEDYIKQIGGVDLIIFDSIMCLTQGDLKETEAWRNTLPWVQKLTRRGIGQIWIHHTGHDESRAYGDKTKEWQLDVVAIMTGDGDGFVDFKLEFKKARERSDDNYPDFMPHNISLRNNEWFSRPAKSSKAEKGPKEKTGRDHCFDILGELMRTKAVDLPQAFGGKAVFRQDWQKAVVDAGICSASVFYTYKAKLKAEGKIGEYADFVWIAAPKPE
jgi:hypothetical protein